MLGVAYVVVPYGLGLAAVGAAPGKRDVFLGAALLALFLARITLKTSATVGAMRSTAVRRCSSASGGRSRLVSLLALLAGNPPLVARGGASCGAGRAGVRFGIVLAAAFAVGFATLVARPERAIVGYKG